MNIGERIHIGDPVPVDQAWPEHAGHRIRYSEHGRTDYHLHTVELTRIGGEPSTWNVGDYDNRPCDGNITETEVWCHTCGVQLPWEADDA